MRAATHSIANLNLGGQRGDLSALRAAVSAESWDAAMASCKTVQAPSGAFHVGVDLMFEPGLSAHRVIEGNAFGDLLPNLVRDGLDVYGWQIRRLLELQQDGRAWSEVPWRGSLVAGSSGTGLVVLCCGSLYATCMVAVAIPPGVLERIVEVLEPEEVWLFGSRARQTHGPDSDWDLMAVLPDTAPDRHLDLASVWSDLRDLRRMRLEVFPVRRRDFEIERRTLGELAEAAAREGCLVYGRLPVAHGEWWSHG